MKKKKIPLRKCVACGEGKPKKDLIRIVNNKDNGVTVDLTGKKNGRGAYICSNINCLNLAIKNKKIPRALGTEIPDNIYEELKVMIKKNNSHL